MKFDEDIYVILGINGSNFDLAITPPSGQTFNLSVFLFYYQKLAKRMTLQTQPYFVFIDKRQIVTCLTTV